MARYRLAAESVGVYQDANGNVLPDKSYVVTGGTLYAAATGSTQQATLLTDSKGRARGWVDEDESGVWSIAYEGGEALTFLVGAGATGSSASGSIVYAKAYIDNVLYATPAAAIAAAVATGLPTAGGRLVLPEGIIDAGATVDLRSAKEFEVVGSARGATTLRYLTDLGSGVWAIRRSDNKRQVIRDLTVLGPTTAVIDGATASMWGVEHLGRNGLDNVQVQGFKAGIVKAGDHGWIRDCASQFNRDGIYYEGQAASGLATWGNHYIDTVDLTGNSRSSIAFAFDGHANGADWRNVHFGIGPTGLYWEVDVSNNAANVQDIVFSGCTWENVGNALFYSASVSQAGVLKATFVGCVTSRVADLSGLRSGALRNQRAHLDGLAAVSVSVRDGEMFPFASGPAPTSLQYGGYQALSMDEGASTTLSTLISTGAKSLTNPLGYPLSSVTIRERQYLRMCESHYCDDTGITSGCLVYRSADGGVKPWVSGQAVYGVALQTGASFGFIMVGRSGIWPVANSATAALAIGDGLIPDTGTADGKATKAGVAPGMIVATAVAAGLGSTTVRADFTPTGWRF